MKESSPEEVAPERLLLCDLPGRLQTVALVIRRLSEEGLALRRRKPSPDLRHFLQGEAGGANYGKEAVGEVTPGSEGRNRRRAQESLALQSTQ